MLRINAVNSDYVHDFHRQHLSERQSNTENSAGETFKGVTAKMVIGTYKVGGALAKFWIFIVTVHTAYGVQYLGKFIGKLSELEHGVSGEVYAVDARTLHIKSFTYDGQGPAAYFYAGSTRAPSNAGFRLRDENGRPDVIRKYRGESITLTLPEGKTLANIRWFSVWCEEFSVNFGDVKIPENFDYPRPQKIEPLNGVHGISSDDIVIVDAQTLLIPHLSYDGEAPDAKFWVGRGPKPSPQGIRVPDENGKEVPLRKYDRKTVVLTLPGDLTIFDIGHFGIWCEAFTVDFGHVQIPSNLNIPPSLKMLGVSPQKRPRLNFIASEVSRPRTQLVGGHNVKPTTYRPPPLILPHHRNDVAEIFKSTSPHHGVVHRDLSGSARQNLVSQNQQQQLQYQQQQLQYQQQQPLFQNQQVQGQQFQVQPNQQYQNQQLQNQQFYVQQFVPAQQILNYQQPNQQQILYQQQLFDRQRLAQEQATYNQLLQNRKLQEEQLIRSMLDRQHNRFGLANNPNYNLG